MIYTGTKNGTDYGFFLEADGIENCIELTEKEHMDLLDGQSAGKVIAFHPDKKPTLEDQPLPTDEQIAEQVRTKRDALITDIEWRLTRYQQQLELGTETNDTADWYASALVYVQALRDVPKQEGFPTDIVWPEIPEE